MAFWRREQAHQAPSEPDLGSSPTGSAGWPDERRDRVSTATFGTGAPQLAALTVEEVLGSTFLHLVSSASLPEDWRAWLSYARPLAGDLVEVLSVDLGGTVVHLRDDDVAGIGMGRLRAAGRRNLLADEIESHEVVGEAGVGAMHVLEGASHFTASKVLEFEELLRVTWGADDLPYGAVVALPSRHLIAFHPIEGVDVLDAVPRLTRLVASLCDGSPGGLSPFVYWWRKGRLTQLSGLDDFGRVRVMVDDELTGVLNELAAQG